MLTYIGKDTLLNVDQIKSIFLEQTNNGQWLLKLQVIEAKGVDITLARYNDKDKATEALDKIKSDLRDIESFINIVPEYSD